MTTYIDGVLFDDTVVHIIEPTEKAMNQYGHACGSDKVVLKDEQLNALRDGKLLAFDINGREYVCFICLDNRNE